MYFTECSICGASLDPGEKCMDCIERQRKERKDAKRIEKNIQIGNYGQFQFVFSNGKWVIIMVERKQVKITATITATAYVRQYDNGETELDELNEELDVEEYEVVAYID